MAKFFRKIRQDFLLKNKFSKYLLYAIGEIVLVVLGILIALQININNQNKKDRKEEQSLLNSLKIELQKNQEQLKGKIEFISSFLDRDSSLLAELSNPDWTINDRVLDDVAMRLGIPSSYNPSQGVIRTIINSGKLDLIRSEELKVLLSSMEGKIEDLYSIQSNIADFISVSVNPYLLKNYSFRTAENVGVGPSKFDFDRMRIIEDRTFENLIVKHWEINTAMRSKLAAIHHSNQRMVKLIEREMKKE